MIEVDLGERKKKSVSKKNDYLVGAILVEAVLRAVS